MKKIIIMLGLFTALHSTAQQEPQYTQNQFNSMLMINPAYAGVHGTKSIGLRYRNQWLGMPGAPKTMNLNAEMRIPNKKLGLGISFANDQLGIYKNNSFDINLGYHIPLSRTLTLSAGTKLGMDFIKSDFSQLIGVDLSDPLYTNQQFVMPYLGLGLLMHTEKWYVGVSSPRIVSFENASPQSKYNTPHLYGYGGLNIPIQREWEIRPAVLTKYQAQAPVMVDVSVDLWHAKTIGIGIGYRTTDAVNLMLKAKFNSINMGYSYDIGLSGNNNFHRGTHEVYFGFDLGGKPGSPALNRQQNNRHF